jgi:Arabidopsis thaliana protein of unknown function (DUF821).
MFSEIKRLSFKHKNNKLWYYTRNYLRLLLPGACYRNLLSGQLKQIEKVDTEYVLRRVNYYNKLSDEILLPANTTCIKELKVKKKGKVYIFDTKEYTRYFDPNRFINLLPGDIITVPELPGIVKSRPIKGENANSVILKLDKIRHFLFVNDKKEFVHKKNMLVSRAKAHQPHRQRFLEMYFNHPMCNIGQVNRNSNLQFVANRLTIDEHLDYKFILCLEGNDVASNLKWVMSSNSLAVMPLPKYETWFMEGTLIPDYHYVLIKDDYSDLEERMNYYIEHTDEALKIIQHAHDYVDQFRNKKREDLISLLVLKKYFEKTGQKAN